MRLKCIGNVLDASRGGTGDPHNAFPFGLFSARSGQMEKVATSLGTGMITAYAYNFAQQ